MGNGFVENLHVAIKEIEKGLRELAQVEKAIKKEMQRMEQHREGRRQKYE